MDHDAPSPSIEPLRSQPFTIMVSPGDLGATLAVWSLSEIDRGCTRGDIAALLGISVETFGRACKLLARPGRRGRVSADRPMPKLPTGVGHQEARLQQAIALVAEFVERDAAQIKSLHPATQTAANMRTFIEARRGQALEPEAYRRACLELAASLTRLAASPEDTAAPVLDLA